MTNPYAAPAAPGSGDRVEWADHNGALMLFEVLGTKEGIATQHGTADAVAVNVAVLDGDHKGDQHRDVLVFPKVLCSQLRPSVGQKVLGRLGQGERKAGKSAPWMLLAPTEADVATAQKFEAYVAKQAATAPSDDPF